MDKYTHDDKKYTRISRINRTTLGKEELSASDMIEFLENGAIYRSFEDILNKVYMGNDLVKDLSEKLAVMTGAKVESIRRNVQNWTRGVESMRPQRKQLFQICFALKLSEEAANELITSVSDMGIHYRNPEELVYAFCLGHGKTWQDAERLLNETAGTRQKIMDICKKFKKNWVSEDVAARGYTKQIQMDFQENVNTEEELKEFLEENVELLGEMHETAYRDFIRMLNLLQNPEGTLDSDEKKSEKMSVENVVNLYLDMHVPKESRRKKGDVSSTKDEKKKYSYLQRVIKKNWPSEDVLNKMRARDVDVSRKVMLLLFLLTEEFEVREPYEDVSACEWTIDDDDLDALAEVYDSNILWDTDTAAERMEIRMIQMDLFLDKYGMNPLDFGNPFDCLVLYALRASVDDEFDDPMSERMKATLVYLFPENDSDK